MQRGRYEDQPQLRTQRGLLSWLEPVVHNISMENVTCQKSEYGVLVNGLDSIVNVYDVIIKNCRFNGVQKTR